MHGVDVGLISVKGVSFCCGAKCKDKSVSNSLSSVFLSQSLSSFSLETFCKLCAEPLGLDFIYPERLGMQRIKSDSQDAELEW